jgi:metallo-beta-lactamase family protein
MQLTFLGAAGEVTGSCYLVDTGEIRFLIDCGMFQGGGEADRKNRSFAFDPATSPSSCSRTRTSTTRAYSRGSSH